MDRSDSWKSFWMQCWLSDDHPDWITMHRSDSHFSARSSLGIAGYRCFPLPSSHLSDWHCDGLEFRRECCLCWPWIEGRGSFHMGARASHLLQFSSHESHAGYLTEHNLPHSVRLTQPVTNIWPGGVVVGVWSWSSNFEAFKVDPPFTRISWACRLLGHSRLSISSLAIVALTSSTGPSPVKFNSFSPTPPDDQQIEIHGGLPPVQFHTLNSPQHPYSKPVLFELITEYLDSIRFSIRISTTWSSEISPIFFIILLLMPA